MKQIRPRTAILLGVIGTIIAAAFSWQPSFWLDECASILAAQRSIPDLLFLLRHVDLVHGVYYFGLHLWVSVAGISPSAVRLPSAIAVGIAVTMTALLASRLLGHRVGISAGIILAVMPCMTWAGTEARSSALTVALTATMSFLLVRAWTRGTRWAWILYSLFAALGVMLFTYIALVVLAHGLAVLWMARGRLTPTVTRWFGSAAGAACIASPILFGTFIQRGQVSWLPEATPKMFKLVVFSQWFGNNVPFLVVAWALIALSIIRFVVKKQAAQAVKLTLLWLVLPTAIILAVSFAGLPMYQPRYLTFSAPAAAILMAAALAALPSKKILVVALVAIAALSSPSYVAQRQLNAKDNSYWSAVAALIHKERAEEPRATRDVAVFGTLAVFDQFSSRAIATAYPQSFAGMLDLTLNKMAVKEGKIWDRSNPITTQLETLRPTDAVWLIEATTSQYNTDFTAMILSQDFHVQKEWTVGNTRIIRYTQ